MRVVCLKKKVRPASLTVEQLKGVALGLNAAVVGSLKQAQWTDLDASTLAETEAEVDKGWSSKCNEVDMKNHFVAKRFPIQQKDKMRLIDNFFCSWRKCQGGPSREAASGIGGPGGGHYSLHDVPQAGLEQASMDGADF